MNIDPRLKALISNVTAKRPRIVLDHILKYGFITTEDLASYGYNHPPRAARDVRELGIPLITFRVTSATGRSIGAYKLGELNDIQNARLVGRSTLPKRLLNTLCDLNGRTCAICGYPYEKRYLQIDHRVPYAVAGEAADVEQPAFFMLLCGTCQRKKSWTCERCDNWKKRDAKQCARCYWGSPEKYSHVAGDNVRRVELTFRGTELRQIQALQSQASAAGERLETLLKDRILKGK